jgi:hypothetical protein
MGNELAAACIFCAGLLLGPDAPPLSGFTGEITGIYGTLRRQTDSAWGPAWGDTTGKFPLVAAGWSRPAPPGLGAGTPASEARIRLAWAASHSEGMDAEGTPGRIMATGAGRFENFEASGRLALTASGSAEVLFLQHRFKGDDVYDVGGMFQNTNERFLTASRRDFAIGWRQRFSGAEVAGRFQYVLLQGKTNNARGVLLANGSVLGGGVEAAFASGPWRFGAGGEFLSGSIPREEQFAPEYVSVSGSDPAHLYAAGVRVERSFGSASVRLAFFWEEARLGWVSYAMIGEEQRRFDDGFRPASDGTSVGADLTARLRVGSGVYLKLLTRVVRTAETVTFTDAIGTRPSATIDVKWPVAHQFAFGLGLEFTLGGSAP